MQQTLSEMQIAGSFNNQQQDIKLRRKDFESKLSIINKTIEEKTNEKEKLVTQQTNIQELINQIEQRTIELEKIKEEKSKIILNVSDKQKAQQARDLENELNTQKEEMLSFNSEKEGLNKKIELLNERKEELSDQIKEIEENINQNKQNIQEYQKNRDEFHEQMQTLAHVQEKMTDKIKDHTKNRDKIYKESISLENDIDKSNTRIESYYDLISRAKYRLPTLDDAIKEIDEELKLYGVEIDSKDLPPVDSLKDSLKTIEETMRELEPVNMRALEEYEHQKQRKDKLDEDIKHLKEQRKNLVKLVDGVTLKKTDRFYEVFKEINKNFQNIYAKLSEGGEAELKLEDPENLFDSGLTIKASPRGKKVLLLSALSGGEKSIASLAFIFSIQEYDPSPFYVLDEVDMFLDGVNAELVSRMVKNNAYDTQFIMVSLRKIALKEANHVYGVTIQDDGISNMIGNIDPDSVGPQGEITVKGG